MTIRGQDIASVIKRQIEEFGGELTLVDVGTVVEAADGVARIHGLSDVRSMELLQFPGDTLGMALNLEEDSVSAVILGGFSHIKEGDEVRSTGRIVEVPVGDALVGRVVDPLGRPLDGKGPVNTSETRPVEQIAPNVVSRKSVDTPLQFGVKIVDGLIPVGRGQRELIIGDRNTGKTSLCLDAIINQKGGDVTCVYVAIGQKASKVAATVATLEQHGAMDHTIVISSAASDPAPVQYLAPYTGATIAEHIMYSGRDALIVYDDLTKHAWAYRQMSLLLRRPPGREAYPGDVFYLHSRLLERSARMNDENGGGSSTALPIIETQAGDLSAYVPTNVISITDGQIYLQPELFTAGIRPALDTGLSVSRVGSAAQTKGMKGVAGRLRLEMAQFREIATFAQFGTDDLDSSTRAQLERGRRATEVLKQVELNPLSMEQQVTIFYLLTSGALDDVAQENILAFESGWHEYAAANIPDVLGEIASSGDLSDEAGKKLDEAAAAYKQTAGL
ncbi:MAG: F0F1 ATP synthase subunit alpha [Chloroflexi bacterium]|nr:F0F1 ATP synthase subunit alpha [Chloroflexota bacterium]MCH8224037.1 F0F1 ATP synthase subunit alpha [Chloroflexota bacterium]